MGGIDAFEVECAAAAAAAAAAAVIMGPATQHVVTSCPSGRLRTALIGAKGGGLHCWRPTAYYGMWPCVVVMGMGCSARVWQGGRTGT